jgi:hypothetical protein
MKLVRLYTYSGKDRLYVMGRSDRRDPKTNKLVPLAGRWTPHKASATAFTLAEARDLTRRLKRRAIVLRIEQIADAEAQRIAQGQLLLDLIGRAAA